MPSLPSMACCAVGSSEPSSLEHHLPPARVLVVGLWDQSAPSTVMAQPLLCSQLTSSPAASAAEMAEPPPASSSSSGASIPAPAPAPAPAFQTKARSTRQLQALLCSCASAMATLDER